MAIANGGTNATSYTQSNGIVTYNGTRLVNYAGPQISSSGYATNTSQPAFFAWLNATVSNVTGNNANYTIIANSTDFNQSSSYSTSTGIFTAPVTGKYFLHGCITWQNLTSANTNSSNVLLTTNRGFYNITNPGAIVDTVAGG